MTSASPNQEVIDVPDEMGIQCKQRSTLQELLESQPGGKVPGKAAQTRLPTLSPPPPPQHPPSPSDLNLATSKGKGRRRAIRWWKEEKSTPPKRMKPKEGPKKLGWGKRALTRGVILKSHLHPGPPLQCWMGLLCLPMALLGTSEKGRSAMWPTWWSRHCYSLKTWLI